MRAVVQRVLNASVTVEGKQVGAIGQGLCVLIGVTHTDDTTSVKKMADKLWNLRIFEDENEQMNRSASDLQLPLLIVSQFTLYGDTRKGRRPSFTEAAKPEVAEPLIIQLVEELRQSGATVATGQFQANMKVALVNDGPVTIIVET